MTQRVQQQDSQAWLPKKDWRVPSGVAPEPVPSPERGVTEGVTELSEAVRALTQVVRRLSDRMDALEFQRAAD